MWNWIKSYLAGLALTYLTREGNRLVTVAADEVALLIGAQEAQLALGTDQHPELNHLAIVLLHLLSDEAGETTLKSAMKSLIEKASGQSFATLSDAFSYAQAAGETFFDDMVKVVGSLSVKTDA